jgi:hypothetical protein
MKRLVALISVATVGAAASASAYTLPSYAYEDMFKMSDLVVIARPAASRDTGERHLDRHVSPPVPVAGVVTVCDALYVLKGPKLKKFKLHHFRDLTDPNRVVIGGPTGISFDIPKNHRYLMFLVREPGGRFVPFAGQTDVVDISVQEISGVTVDW